MFFPEWAQLSTSGVLGEAGQFDLCRTLAGSGLSGHLSVSVQLQLSISRA